MSDESSIDRIFKLIDAFEEDLELNSAAMENPAVLRRLKFKLSEISGYDHYIAEKTGEITALLETFFSARKHKKYPGGASAVYSKIVHEHLVRIRQRAKEIKMGLAEGGEVAK